MLEKPDIPESYLADALRSHYGLRAREITFLPLGADVNTAVFRVTASAGEAFFLKLRRGPFDEITVNLPHWLHQQGNPAIIPPLPTLPGLLWASLPPYRAILYPFVDGQNGYEARLTDGQWLAFGAALRSIHAASPPPELRARIPAEDYSPIWREQVRAYQQRAGQQTFAEPVAARLAAFLRARRPTIDRLVQRAGQLAAALPGQPLETVLCHTDLHPGNLHLTPGGSLYIVDWDAPRLAPRERDLMFIGAGMAHREDLPREMHFFYQGYGDIELHRPALAYFRLERIIADLAAFCAQLLDTEEGGPDREQSYIYCTGQFLPGHEIDVAFASDSDPNPSN